jgi:hypothetical protein
MALSAPTDLANRITALGPWFHNLCLDGVYTAQFFKPEAQMPDLTQFDGRQLQALVAYLRQLQ